MEAAAGAALVTGAVVLFSPGDLWLGGAGFHPVWIPILVLAARYGLRGLFVALPLSWGMVMAVNAALGAPWAGLAARATGTCEIMALVSAVLVAWVARLHENRIARLGQRLGECETRRDAAEETIVAQQDSINFLRARQDRLEISLSLWRVLARQLERGDASEAARAALQLCAIRAGAAAGVVQAWDGARMQTLAWRGQWSPTQARPRDIGADRTAMHAISRRRPVTAGEVPDAGREDGDIAVPVMDDRGGVVAVVCLRGVTPSRLRAADISDLMVIAQWLAPAIARRATRSSSQISLPALQRVAQPVP